MKPENGIEMLTPAWNRYVEIVRTTNRTDLENPVRIRGYTEMRMSNVTMKERKKMRSAVLRGYRLANSDRATQLLELLLMTEDYRLGYSGKTQAQMWFPSKEARDDCVRHVEAMAVMTDKFNAHRDIKVYGDQTFNIWVNSRGWNNEQLKAHLTEARIVFDEHMDKWKDMRMPLADRIMDDDWVCRIPFTSKGDD